MSIQFLDNYHQPDFRQEGRMGQNSHFSYKHRPIPNSPQHGQHWTIALKILLKLENIKGELEHTKEKT